VVDTEHDLAGLEVFAQQTGGLEEIEQDAPAGDLRVMIGAGVVLPHDLAGSARHEPAEAADEDVQTVHQPAPFAWWHIVTLEVE